MNGKGKRDLYLECKERTMDNPELDREIAEKFLGWHTEIVAGDLIWFDKNDDFTSHDNFKPSSDPASCSLVLDEIERREWLWTWSRVIGGGAGFEIITKEGKTFFAINYNRYRAVCEAVMGAIEGE